MAPKEQYGRCALTGKHGKFVKCHILPQAFTKPSVNGAPLYQSSKGGGERRRWSSWYDKNLVIREGEDILSEIDDKAIKQLRKHQLVWDSWRVFRPHFDSFSPLMPNHGLRKIKISNSDSLIRFALSVAWRASASSMQDMQEADLDSEMISSLKDYVLGKEIYGASSFPISLVQISTPGEIHNQSPYVTEKQLFDIQGSDSDPLKIMRMYMDGLIFHVHLSPIPEAHLKDNPIFIGAADYTLVTAVTYEASFQYENMLHVMRETFL